MRETAQEQQKQPHRVTVAVTMNVLGVDERAAGYRAEEIVRNVMVGYVASVRWTGAIRIPKEMASDVR